MFPKLFLEFADNWEAQGNQSPDGFMKSSMESSYFSTQGLH